MATSKRMKEQAERKKWAIALHGGAGTISKTSAPEKLTKRKKGLQAALEIGVKKLKEGASAVDVAEAVVRSLEDCPYFNAGRGSVLAADGKVYMEASIMDGSTKACGAVTGVTTVQNPISLAKAVMQKTENVFYSGIGAEEFATTVGLKRQELDYFITKRRKDEKDKKLEKTKPKGTVGCVVLDQEGRLAAATSTGGQTAKKFGRIGDSPIIGAGNHANELCAVSGTGFGEQFIRHNVAYDVYARMKYGGATLEAATKEIITKVLAEDDGGLVAVDKFGNISMPFNSLGMNRAAADGERGIFSVSIHEEELPLPIKKSD